MRFTLRVCVIAVRSWADVCLERVPIHTHIHTHRLGTTPPYPPPLESDRKRGADDVRFAMVYGYNGFKPVGIERGYMEVDTK